MHIVLHSSSISATYTSYLTISPAHLSNIISLHDCLINMDAEPQQMQLHVALFPFLAHGHMIPTLDVARLLSARNVKATIITTHVNAPYFTKAIENGKNVNIDVEMFRFPAQEVGLPEGFENVERKLQPEQRPLFMKALTMLQDQLEQYLEKTRPNCLVASGFYPWATESAAKFNIPRLEFSGTGYFPLCAFEVLKQHAPWKNVSSDDEPFVLPLIPHEIKMLRTQIPERLRDEEDENTKESEQYKEAEEKSYGVLINSFYELEPDYANFFTKELGRRAWHIGPVSLCNRSNEDKFQRGKKASIDVHECSKWLNSQKPASVIYICFGSMTHFTSPQLHEIAMALEASGQNFIWVVRNVNDGENDEWLPSGFEERTEGKGLIIRGWAPQVVILEHEAIGAFVTHCGWNSTLEGISAGVPMVTWPVFAEQFYNEKLVTEILKIGVPVGVKKWNRMPTTEDVIKRDVIEKALREIMGGDEAGDRRHRAKQLKELAWKAVKEGGSSHSDLTALIAELKGCHA